MHSPVHIVILTPLVSSIKKFLGYPRNVFIIYHIVIWTNPDDVITHVNTGTNIIVHSNVMLITKNAQMILFTRSPCSIC